MATDRTPLILPRLVSRDVSSGNGQGAIIKRTSNTKYIAPFTIVVALERFTYYSLIVNLLLFFNDNVYENKTNKNGIYAGFADINAIVSVMVLVGLSWLFCVLGGWISDAKLGKLKTIIWGLVVYALGTGLLVLSAFFLKHQIIQKRLYRALIVFGSILIALLGEGAYKANIAAFGAEQLDHKDPVSTRRYFNFYYFSLNIGSLFALSISAYIQQWKGFVIGFALPFGSITLALIVFVLSRRRYKMLPCQQIVGKVYQIIKEARRNSKRNDQSSPITLQRPLSWLDHARMKYGGSFLDWEVDETRFLFAIIPVFIVLLPYQTIYNQMNATFLQQGIHMNLNVLHNFDNFPAAWLSFFNAVVIVILLPIMDRLVYPWLTKRGYNMNPLTRISIGILVGCFAIIAAGFVEIFVVQDFMKNNTVTNDHVNQRTVKAANLSVFYQIPQYLLIGVSEIFANVGGLELAYRNAPRSMQGLVMALFFAINSFGSLLGSGLLALGQVSGLINRKTKKGRKYYDLTYYFFLLCGLMLISWIVFIIYIERNRRKRSRQPRTRMFNRTRGPNSPDISSVADLPTDNYYNS